MRFDASIFTAPRNETLGQLRAAGVILLLLGPIIFIGGAVLVWLLLAMRIPAEWLPEGTRIEGTPGNGLSRLQRAGLWALASLLLACGTAAVLQGFWQLVFGRKNRILLVIIVGVTIVIVAAGVVASMVTGCPIGRICH